MLNVVRAACKPSPVPAEGWLITPLWTDNSFPAGNSELLVTQRLFSIRCNYGRNAENMDLLTRGAGNSLLPQSVFQHFICLTHQIPFS